MFVLRANVAGSRGVYDEMFSAGNKYCCRVLVEVRKLSIFRDYVFDVVCCQKLLKMFLADVSFPEEDETF